MRHLFKRMKRGPKQVEAALDAGFVAANGSPYLQLLEAMHVDLKPQCYLEIGTRKGDSLTFAQCRSIAIDPEFMLDCDVVGAKPALTLLQQTSDDAFASDFFAETALQIDFAFLDGMHLFEYLLRDFINVEKHAAHGATIAMHDCVPQTHKMAERDWDKAVTKAWTGDVWKLLPILRQYRPDLTVRVMNAAPTGLVLLSGLDPTNRTLSDAYDDILGHFMPMQLTDYGVSRFFADFEMVDTAPDIARIRSSHGGG